MREVGTGVRNRNTSKGIYTSGDEGFRGKRAGVKSVNMWDKWTKICQEFTDNR